MGGSESLFDGVSGLSNHQTWMNVIGNNIANVNTTGYKDQLFNFMDQLSEVIRGASAAVPGGPGGTDFVRSDWAPRTARSSATSSRAHSRRRTCQPTLPSRATASSS